MVNTQGTFISLISAPRIGVWSCRSVWQSHVPSHPPPHPYLERGLWALLSYVPLLPDTENHLDATGKAGCLSTGRLGCNMAFSWGPWDGVRGGQRGEGGRQHGKKFWRLGLRNELGVARRSSPRWWIYNHHICVEASMAFKRWGLFRRQGHRRVLDGRL